MLFGPSSSLSKLMNTFASAWASKRKKKATCLDAPHSHTKAMMTPSTAVTREGLKWSAQASCTRTAMPWTKKRLVLSTSRKNEKVKKNEKMTKNDEKWWTNEKKNKIWINTQNPRRFPGFTVVVVTLFVEILDDFHDFFSECVSFPRTINDPFWESHRFPEEKCEIHKPNRHNQSRQQQPPQKQTRKHELALWWLTILPGWVITRVGRCQNPQYTRAHFGGEAVGCSLALHDTTPMSPRKRNTMTTKRDKCHWTWNKNTHFTYEDRRKQIAKVIHLTTIILLE